MNAGGVAHARQNLVARSLRRQKQENLRHIIRPTEILDDDRRLRSGGGLHGSTTGNGRADEGGERPKNPCRRLGQTHAGIADLNRAAACHRSTFATRTRIARGTSSVAGAAVFVVGFCVDTCAATERRSAGALRDAGTRHTRRASGAGCPTRAAMISIALQAHARAIADRQAHESAQVPLMHISPAPHVFPQFPQWSRSVFRLRQFPLQLLSPA
jgi:hypothetical protein